MRWESEVGGRLAVVLPTVSCGVGGDREMTASEGGVVSIGSESESAFRPVVVLPTALSGAWGWGTRRWRPERGALCPLDRSRSQPSGWRLCCPQPCLWPGENCRCCPRGRWHVHSVVVRVGGGAEAIVPPMASCGSSSESESAFRPAVVLPMASCGTGGMRGLLDRPSTLALGAGICKL